MGVGFVRVGEIWKGVGIGIVVLDGRFFFLNLGQEKEEGFRYCRVRFYFFVIFFIKFKIEIEIYRIVQEQYFLFRFFKC